MYVTYLEILRINMSNLTGKDKKNGHFFINFEVKTVYELCLN